jgi:hypothetical protein
MASGPISAATAFGPGVTTTQGRTMIPNHILNDLTPDNRVAILSRGGEIHFHVHPSSDTPDAIRAHAAREGSEVLTTHMRDQGAIQAFVAARERDIGGEG